MKRLIVLFVVAAFGSFGCGGGGGGGGPLQPVNVEGKWVGKMDHDVNGELLHYDVALVLFQEGSHVTGTMVLEYGEDGHGGRIDGQMTGNHFTGTRSSLHVVDIEFDVNGDTLVGTFTFVSPEENLDEHGTFVCKREGGGPDSGAQVAAARSFYCFCGKEWASASITML